MSRTAAGALLAVALGCLAAVTAPSGASALTCEAATLTLPAVADAWIDELSPDVNRGSDAILEVETSPEGGDARALVRFSVPPVPAGCEVESARLRLFSSSATDGARLEALPAAAGWSEGGVTWTSQPADAGAAAVAWSRDGYVQWNVTGQVRAGAGNGFVIRALLLAGEGAGHGFHSREKGEDTPQLVVRFAAPATGDPPPPAAPVPAAARCGDVIDRSIRLTAGLADCPGDGLVIGAPRIVVDLGGHTIDGVGLGTGVRNDGFASVTVRNGTIREFDRGVELLSETAGNLVEGLLLEGNQLAGIELFDARAGNVVRANAVAGNGDGIALVSGTTGADVSDNTITGSGGAGLLLRDATGSVVSGNDVVGGGDLGIGLERSSGNRLTGNEVDGNSDGGIELTLGSHGNVIEDNELSASGDTGILVKESDRNVLEDNEAEGMSDSGISLESANDGVVRDNEVGGNTGGLQLDGSSRNLVEHNDASGTSGIGIEVGDGAFGNLVVRNIASDNGATGIYVAGEAVEEPANVVARNVADGNGANGIELAKGGHVLAGNLVRGNRGWGIDAEPGNVDGGGNRAAGNGQAGQCSGVACLAPDPNEPDPTEPDPTDPDPTDPDPTDPDPTDPDPTDPDPADPPGTDPTDPPGGAPPSTGTGGDPGSTGAGVRPSTTTGTPPACGRIRLVATADAWIGRHRSRGGGRALEIGRGRLALVRFAPPALPRGCALAAATLVLSGPAGAGTQRALRIAAPWHERRVSWANRPPVAGPAAAGRARSGRTAFDVTAQLRAGAAHGFLIRGGARRFHSREHPRGAPRLIIRFGAA